MSESPTVSGGIVRKVFRGVATATRVADTIFIMARRLLTLALMIGLIRFVWPSQTAMPDHFVLDIDLNNKLVDTAQPSALLATLDQDGGTLADLILKISQASQDPRVTALRLTLGQSCCDLVAAQEVRDALVRFSSNSHKLISAYAYGFGDGTGSLAEYLIATAADRITLQEEGSFSANGLHLEMPFVHEALDRIGVTPHFTKHGLYKTYPETFERDDPSPAHREMLDSIADSLYASVTEQITASRQLDRGALDTALAASPLSAADALTRHLIDEVRPFGGTDQSTDSLPIARYTLRPATQAKPPRQIAVLVAAGSISEPGSRRRSLQAINPLALIDDLEHAANDPAIAAIILRVDSPGGSATGAALIDREIRQIVASKPVVVTMGTNAASGGYWLSSHASIIIADPETLTGSIGAFSGKFEFRQLAATLGVHYFTVDRGAPTSVWSSMRGLTDTQAETIATSVDQIYQTFIAVVADGRKLAKDDVEKIAGGRVWTGTQAVALHLVDRIGGYPDAIAAAERLAGLPITEPAPLVFPRRSGLSDDLAGAVGSLLQSRVMAAIPQFEAGADLADTLDAMTGSPSTRMLPLRIQ
jgi:protease-4